ncbi:hypothetical protein DKX38_007431 [Salix brachista]|uniref:phosphoglycerate mutase (2,3-diphosphoglycerate-dependent) n=1 Tax=Salix brachista TaxID=2182728 RepID=A0A5N5MN96_9ROSI|nr:hypothetical protein DKX38_007431 [Salix brachista]
MAAGALHRSIRTIQLHGCSNDSAYTMEYGSSSLKLISKGFTVDVKFLSNRSRSFNHCKMHVFHAISSHGSVIDPTLSTSHVTTNFNQNTSIESSLILIRHGESMWNERNLFTGSVDVPLTKRGIEEAIEAGKRISSIPVNMIYTSALIRAQMTAMLAMTQHRQKKSLYMYLCRTNCGEVKSSGLRLIPIIMHDESIQAKEWTQIFSEETIQQSIPVITAWQLNERMYGKLQGLNKEETVVRYGKEKVHEWRRSFDSPPPNGESLEMCSQRAVAFFKENIEPQLQNGRNIVVAAHGNSLRSIIMYLEKLTSQEVTNLELSTGVPLLYIYKHGGFLKRGSPVGPTEYGVYAYTRVPYGSISCSICIQALLYPLPASQFYNNSILSYVSVKQLSERNIPLAVVSLALYREKLDEMVQ